MKIKILSSLFLVLAVYFSSSAQEKLITRTAKVTFFSSTAMEDFDAENNQVASILMVSDHRVAFNVLLKSFKFDKALMEEHFNEKYVNSDKYPSAKFKGVIPSEVDLKTANTYTNIDVKGEMIFHGVTKPLTVKADIVVNEDKTIVFNSSFKLNLEEYKVEIPSLVKDKIAEDVKVVIVANYK